MVTLVTVALVAWYVFCILASIYIIGRPRDPMTPGVAIANVIVGGLIIAGVLYLASV